MAGLDHDFYLVSVDDVVGPDEYGKGHNMEGGVAIYDDHLAYMADTLGWIKTYNPSKREPYQGLCWFGPTVIRIEGAQAAVQVFQAWANLFKIGPEILKLRGYYTEDDEHPLGYYDRLEIPRDEFVSKLSTLASWAQQIIDSEGRFFILHLGI